MERLTINIKNIIQMSALVLLSLVFIIYMAFKHSKDFDPVSPQNFIPSDIQMEKTKYANLEKDMVRVKEVMIYKMEHPTPIPYTPPRKYMYGGWVNIDNTPKNSFGVVIKKPGLGQQDKTKPNIVGVTQGVPKKQPQKMIRYDDWVDEVEELQKQPQNIPLIKIEE